LREISLILDGEQKRLVRAHNDRMSLAWHIVAIERQKKLPRLKDIVIDATPRRRQTPAEIEAVARSWLAGRRT